MTDGTIAAISTPSGEGGISVIRISGERSFEITDRIFFTGKNRTRKFRAGNESSHTIHFGYISDNDELLDEVLVSIFKNPHTYTGEDVIEISSHGGSFVSRKILDLILRNGARHAEPGEFTKRAFLNGRIDLSQAEAVADLIKSQTDAAHASSIKQLEGKLSEFVNKTRQNILDITSLVELELDFAEEGLEFVKKDEIRKKITDLNLHLERIIDSYIRGKVIRDGVNLVIAGKPNSGKSSLFNYLLKTNRSIVSHIAGTTRDYIEESILIKGILFNLIDTAGLRHSKDEIESEGIRRSHKKMEEADMILYLIDSSVDKPERAGEFEYFEKNFDERKSLLVFTKGDLSGHHGSSGLTISLLEDETIEKLKVRMVEKVMNGVPKKSEETVLTNLRHKICLENVVSSLNNAVRTIDEGLTGEFISVDLRNAMKYLGEITGEVTNDEILNNIFGKFCIGK